MKKIHSDTVWMGERRLTHQVRTNQLMQRNVKHPFETCHHTLLDSFHWEVAIEGIDFWEEIYNDPTYDY